jgi:tricorn protease
VTQSAGYYRFPTIHANRVVFVCEDDLWSVDLQDGLARRLTTNPGVALHPSLSPDGKLLAYTSRDEGSTEVYLMSALGGPSRRLTYLESNSRVIGWTPDGKRIIFSSNVRLPMARLSKVYTISPEGGDVEEIEVGFAVNISYGPNGGAVLGRNTNDLANWKRYRGGLTGDLWVDSDGDHNWRRLIQLEGNVAQPLWIGERIYFISDHAGVANIYSTTPQGEDLRQHSFHKRYYVRNISSDGRSIVYQSGGDLYRLELESQKNELIKIEFYSSQSQRKRRFVSAERYIQSFALHPKGQSTALITRGNTFSFSNWEGAVFHLDAQQNGRSRLVNWLHDGKRLAFINDSSGEEQLTIAHADASQATVSMADLEIGRAYNLRASPSHASVALSNHRHELMVIDLEQAQLRVLDQSNYGPISDFSWSPDGRWLAYNYPISNQLSIIKLYDLSNKSSHEITRPVMFDREPCFDPEGKYLYFLSNRNFEPVADSLQFDLNFPKSAKPYLITLQADLPSPFVAQAAKYSEEAAKEGSEKEQADTEVKKGPKEIQIDLEGIQDRVLAFPLPTDNYQRLRAIKGKLLYTVLPIVSTFEGSWMPGSFLDKSTLWAYDFESREPEQLIKAISYFELSLDATSLIYVTRDRLRVVRAGEKAGDKGDAPSRASGWLDLSRIKLALKPSDEWRQIFREAWRLQRDHFWSADMLGIDWLEVYQRYEPLLERINTRGELTDLLGEMQGELGTSHAYAFGGDNRPEPNYRLGHLGAEWRYDSERERYLFTKIVRGDVWDEGSGSPLARAGSQVQLGEALIAINGQRVGPDLRPEELLLNQANNEVLLTVEGLDAKQRSFSVKALPSDRAARYRDWVESNRHAVHKATDGKIGYLHIPDMDSGGYAEFYRGFLAELQRDGLIVDVRFNGGGYVSELLLEKLSHRRIGYFVPRWQAPTAYPSYSLAGPIVAITNEEAGSDGDIFSHGFKLLKIGPLIGKRTWGGVVGIHPRDILIDGGFTTQPELATWFSDVAWKVENYGTQPDIEVEYRPQDHRAGRDPQLERAIEEALSQLKANPVIAPNFAERPTLAIPKLEE